MKDDKFTIAFAIRYQDTDRLLRATPAAVVGAMQEAAILHSEEVGRGIDWLQQRSLGWMVAQTRAKVLKLPAWRTRLAVTTWPSEMGRLLSRREFVLRDESNTPLIVATTLWAFVDRGKRKVTRIPPEVSGAYRVLPERALDLSFGRPAVVCDPGQGTTFSIAHHDIDYNGHVNNLRYLEWALEALPSDILAKWSISELNIRYQKETGPDGAIRSQAVEVHSPAPTVRVFAHQVLNQQNECVAAAETSWIENDNGPTVINPLNPPNA